MKPGQYFALITGILFLAVGLMGFIPGFVREPMTSPDAVGLGMGSGYGDLMGMFPINVLHNVVHIIVGLSGIFAAIALDGSRVFSRALAVFYGLLAIMGLVPGLNTTFGLIPIFGNDIWLHALTAAIAFYFGFIASPGLLELSSQQSQQFGGTSKS
ncbi:MAG TPA: DUF4383 domain-containing protein [Crinalium sp.]|jgi:hypothetical protein